MIQILGIVGPLAFGAGEEHGATAVGQQLTQSRPPVCMKLRRQIILIIILLGEHPQLTEKQKQ